MKNKIISIVTALILISTISAFGISSPYWEGNPLTMKPGETKIIDLNLQNMVGDEDITVKAEIIQGEDIISLKQDTFFIKAQTSDTIIPLEITIPKEIKDSDRYIKIDFKKISGEAQGVTIGTGMSIYFDIVINKEQNKKINLGLIIGIGAVLLLVILWRILKKK